ncbi:MAG: aminotransferase class I/II-fold pyridoxal phosphate-dependent enzyme [Acidobacteria bacterium]|nr:MAG: aminotransferase class I/II-fold pyridoxal phosphate-dependent enzyme [Acidobacteriota bacterium]
MEKPFDFATLAVHAGEAPCPATGALDTPIYQSTTFVSRDSDEMAAVYGEQKPGYMYTRYGNPTIHALEAKLAALEGGGGALATASGMAAVSTAILGYVKSGDHVVAARSLYGAAYNFLNRKLPRMGASTTFVKSTRVEDFEKALQPNTRLIYFETPSNPVLDVVDIASIAALGRARGIPTVLDNTFASPALQQPLRLGVTVSIHSATKYLCGHGDAMGGAIISSSEHISLLAHDVIRDYGGIISPFNAWLILRGIHTLHLRMPAHCSNARQIAGFLAAHSNVERVYYPGLPHHPGHELAKKQMSDFGAMISFEAKGGYQGGKQVMDRVKLFARAASLGDTRSLIVHPASTSHRAVPPEDRRAIGITDGLVRLSVGIEAAADLIADLEQALRL